MKTRITKDGDKIIVAVDGKLDYETQEPLKEKLAKIISDERMSDAVAKQIIFDFKDLEFIGSSGISNFIQTLKDFSSRSNSRPIYKNVGSEFQRVIKAFDDEDVIEFENPIPALRNRKPMDN